MEGDGDVLSESTNGWKEVEDKSTKGNGSGKKKGLKKGGR